MKTRKIIVAILMGAILFPSVSFAQTTSTISPTRDELVMKLIANLMEQIKLLQAQLATLQNNTNTNSISESTGLTISLSKVEEDSNSVQISWITSIPATSKVIISKSQISNTNKIGQREVPSINGTSTKGLVKVDKLEQNTKYYFLIKSTDHDSYVELGGSFTTEKSAEQIAKEKKEADKANAEALSEQAKRLEKTEALKRDGYYIECNEDKSWCVKWISKMCWQERTRSGAYYGTSCGG